MIASIHKRINADWAQWFRKRSLHGNPQYLSEKNCYILPSAFGWAYAVVLLTLLSGAINYQISALFLMVFLLAVIGLTSAWEAHANLKDLSIQLISINDAQRGTPAQMILLLQPQRNKRFSMEFQIGPAGVTTLDIIPPEGLQYILPIQTTERGCFSVPKLIVSSRFPFGIFRVWGYAYFDAQYYVYPEPIPTNYWPAPVSHPNDKKHTVAGDDEYYDLKQVENPWSQPRLIAWKIAAKGQGWYLKTQSGNEGDYWLFKLSDVPNEDLETQLQHLSYWLQTAELNQQFYGLQLGSEQTPLAQGPAHLQHCLRQLAVYQ